MDVIKSLLDSLGIECKPVEEEQRIKLKCDAYNEQQGDLSGYDCTLCHNKGFTAIPKYVDGVWLDVMAECKCIKIRAALKRIKASGLETTLKNKTFEKFEASEEWQNELKHKAYDYYKNPAGWFFVGGQSGCGKTHLCTAIAGGLIKSGKALTYMQWIDDTTKLKGCVTDGNAYDSMINCFKESEVLYIDDLFKTGNDANNKPLLPTAADIKIAFEILNYRAINNYLTIISSERTAADLIQIDEATAGRIIEMSENNLTVIKKDISKNHRLKGIL